MKRNLAKVMTPNPVTLPHTATLREASEVMAKAAIGDVMVTDGDRLCGLVTDRDIVVHGLAAGMDPNTAQLKDVCRHFLVSLTPEDTSAEAVRLMREHAIRRLPVVDNGRAVGVVSLGDLAIERDPESALATISAAPSTD